MTTLSVSSSPSVSPHISLSTTGRRIRNSLSYYPSSLSSKFNKKRINYLRQKILKTLTKPNPSSLNTQTLQDLHPRIDSDEIPTNSFQQEEEPEEEEKQEVKEIVSRSPPIPNPFGFDSPKLFINIALCFLGLFVFETVCTVLILGSADSDEKSGNSTVGVETVGEKNEDRGFYSDESEFQKKVSEIRVLASEARAIERKKSRKEASVSSAVGGDNGDDVINDTATSRVRTDVRKEVDRRLLKLRKSLQSRREKSSNSDAKSGNLAFRKNPAVRVSSMKSRNHPKGFGGLKNNENPLFSGESDGNGLLDQGVQRADLSDGNFLEEEESRWLSDDEVLKRVVLKLQANEEAGRDLFSGFSSVEEMNFFNALERKFAREGWDHAEQWMAKRVEGVDLSNDGSQKSGPDKALEESVKPYETTKSVVQRNISDITEKLIERSESGHGTSVSGIENSNGFQEDFQTIPSTAENSLHDKIYASQISEGTSNRNEGSLTDIKSRELGTKISQHSGNVKKDNFTISGKKILSSSNGSSKSQLQTKKVKRSMLHKVSDSESNIENNFWWLDLPYVLAIHLRRGTDHKGSRGLYSLKMNGHSGNGSSSYTIAFEDRGDATNFCYLLESFFEDLGDFSANVVPLSIKELEEGVKSKGMKILVVRKGQLQLYAGQPLADVEMSLHSILE